MSSNPAIKRRPPRPRNKAAPAPSSSSGQVVDGDGFILKKTRHGRRKPPVSTTPQAPNPSRSTRNQRRRRNKQQQQREGGPGRDREDEKESELDNVSRVADDIQAYYPQLTDRRVLESAIRQLRLRSFDPTDEQILDIIANIQTQSLLHPGDTAAHASKEVSNDSVDDDDEDDDDDDEDEVEEQEQEEDEYEDEEEEEEYENDDDEDEDDDEDDDDDDDDDGDDDDGDEEDEDDDDDEEDETMDHEDEKESSEAPMKYETSTKNGSRVGAPQQPSQAVATSTSAEDADKKRKRNRRRRRKKSATDSLHNLDDVDVEPEPVNDRDRDRDDDDHGDGGDEDDDYEDDEDVKEEDDDDASRSVSQSRQHKKKRSRTKHKKAAPLTLGEELKSFDLRDVAVCIPKLQEWVVRLQTESKLVANANAVTAQTRAACSFLREFLLSNGIEILVERVLTAWPALQASVDSRDVELLSRALISIWDATLSGSHSYHEWLFDECVKLSAELAKLASTKTMNDEDVHGVIREQCKHLVAAQKKTWIDAAGTGATTVSGTSGTSEVRHGRSRKNKKKLQASNVSVHAPFSAQSCASHLLSAGHHANDPIVSVVQKLDPCVDGLSACFAELSLHDDSIAVECATQRASFANDYRSIEASVDRDLQFIGHRSSALERELLTTQSHKQKVVREQASKVAPLEQRLEARRRERAHLQQEQEAIEAQLAEVRQRLATCDVFVAGIEQEVADILRSFEPSTSALFSSMDDYQFEIAAYAQQRECYANLLQVVRASFQRLQSWSRTRTQNDSEQRVLLETQYVQELSAYFDGLCGVLQMLVERVAQLKEHMAAIERTHAVRTRNYGRASRGGEESAAIVKQLERDVVVDEETMARMREVMHLHLQTAASIVSKPLFAKFVGHIEQRVTPTQIMLDLAPYRERERPPMHMPMHHAQQQQASNDVQTQTNYGASAYHAAPSSASTTTTTVTAAVPPPHSHSHGHRSSSSSTRASAVAPPQTRDRDRERDRVQQQHHFRPPPQSQQQSNGSMSQARKPPMSTKSAAAANKQQQQQSDSLNGNTNVSKKPPLSSQSQSHQQRPPRRQQQQQQPRRAPMQSNNNANAMYY